MALRRTLAWMCLLLAVTTAWGCKRRQDEPAPTTTRGALPPPPGAEPEPAPEPEPEPEPRAARPPPPPAPPPIEEPVDERPHWQKVLDSQEPGALMGRRRVEPSANAASAPTVEESAAEKSGDEAAKRPPAPAPKPAPAGTSKTYCTWQYYSSIQFMCSDLEPSVAKEKCEKAQSAKLGEPIVCICVPAEGYAPQCM